MEAKKSPPVASQYVPSGIRRLLEQKNIQLVDKIPDTRDKLFKPGYAGVIGP